MRLNMVSILLLAKVDSTRPAVIEREANQAGDASQLPLLIASRSPSAVILAIRLNGLLFPFGCSLACHRRPNFSYAIEPEVIVLVFL